MMNHRKPRRDVAGCALFLVTFALCILAGCGKRSEPSNGSSGFLPVTHNPARHDAAPGRCVACHAATVAEWRTSHHALANRPIDPARDGAFFHHPVASSETTPYRSEVIDGRLVIVDSTIPGGSKYRVAPVQGVIGVDPLLQYLIPAEGGRWQAHALAYDPANAEWFDVFADETRQPGEWGHWTGQGMNWNANCAACHMTEFSKNYDVTTNSYDSTWTAHGIGCLQCHGNSIAHADAAEAGNLVSANLGQASPTAFMENCASCHSRREELTPHQFTPGDRFHQHFRLALPDARGAYFPDGQSREENFVYGSFMLSKMGHAGVTCLDCHNPHSGDTILPTHNNALCMRCHGTGLLEAPTIESTEHSHHAPDSTGNRCIECHMPERIYMQRDPRRDHGFTIPDPYLTLELGVPNACNQCHTDQSVQWAADHVASWYSSDTRETRRKHARLMANAHETRTPNLAQDLIAVAREAANPYWKATYLRLLNELPPSSEVSRLAKEALEDEHPSVRAAATQLLAREAGTLPIVRRALTDPVREVRVQATQELYSLERLPEKNAEEWEAYLHANADRPQARMRLAEMALQAGDIAKAEKHLRQAIAFDQLNGQLYFDAAILLSRASRADRAFAILHSAPEAVGQSGLLAYADGLLSAERGNYGRAIEQLEIAVARDPRQTRWWYNLALAYAENHNIRKAKNTVERGLLHAPNDPDLLYLERYFQATGP